MQFDGSAEFARASSHRIGDIGRGDMAVGHGLESGFHTFEIKEGMDFFDLFRPDDMRFIARKLRDAIDLSCTPVTAPAGPAPR